MIFMGTWYRGQIEQQWTDCLLWTIRWKKRRRDSPSNADGLWVMSLHAYWPVLSAQSFTSFSSPSFPCCSGDSVVKISTSLHSEAEYSTLCKNRAKACRLHHPQVIPFPYTCQHYELPGVTMSVGATPSLSRDDEC